MQLNSSNADITSNFSVISYPQWIEHIHLLTYNDYLECQENNAIRTKYIFFPCINLAQAMLGSANQKYNSSTLQKKCSENVQYKKNGN